MPAPAPNRCLPRTTAIGGLLMSLWLAICPIVALAAQSPLVNRVAVTGPGTLRHTTCRVPVDRGTDGAGGACCCVSQACQCCNLSVNSSGSPNATAATEDSSQTQTTPNPGLACDCGCQRPLLPPATPGAPSSSILVWLAWRQPGQFSHGFGNLPLNPPTTIDSNRNARDRGHWLSGTPGPGQRQATLNRWLI